MKDAHIFKVALCKEDLEYVEGIMMENIRLREALEEILNELDVPGEGYPALVSNAVEIATNALKESE